MKTSSEMAVDSIIQGIMERGLYKNPSNRTASRKLKNCTMVSAETMALIKIRPTRYFRPVQ